MFFNRYVLALLVTGLLSLTGLGLIMTRLDPIADQQLALPLFFLSLFFATGALTSLLGYAIRVMAYHDELFLNHFNVSLRQGIILGICVCGLMGLQLMRTLTWWNTLLIVIISFLVELYFVAQD